MGKHRKLNPGDVVESLELLENLGYRQYCGYNTTYWRCKCLKCGNIIDVPLKNLGKAQKDCGCWRSEIKKSIPSGTRFGRLTVIAPEKQVKGRSHYRCRCDCGKEIVTRAENLQSGDTRSCGCIHDELFQKNTQMAYKNSFVNGTNKYIITEHYGESHSNNTSGVSGVNWHKRIGKWQARITYQKKTYHLGYYEEIKEAEKVVKTAREHIKKDFLEWYSQKEEKEEERHEQGD